MIDRQLLIHAYGDTPAVVATALRSARNAAAELGSDVSVHVVVQGPAVRELADQSDLSGELEESILDPRVVVLACRNSLRNRWPGIHRSSARGADRPLRRGLSRRTTVERLGLRARLIALTRLVPTVRLPD